MQRWQQQIDQIFERFQDRWDTDQSYRTTVSVGVIAVSLVLLCSVVGVALRVTSNLLGGANSATPTAAIDSSELNNSSGQATFTLPTLTPAANAPGSNSFAPTPVNSTNTDVPTATSTPLPPGATPTPTANPNATPTVTITSTATAGTITAIELNGNTMQPNKSVSISIATSPPVPNVTVQIAFQYATGCSQNNLSVTLDPGGQAILKFIVASCLPTTTKTVTGTFTLPGQTPVSLQFGAN